MHIIDYQMGKLGKNRKFGQRLRERKKEEERPVLEPSLRELKIPILRPKKLIPLFVQS